MAGDRDLAVLDEQVRDVAEQAPKAKYNDNGKVKLEMESNEAPKPVPGANGKEPINVAAETPARPRKDMWDKLTAVAPIISGMLIFAIGGFFTYSYNEQQLKLQELQTIERFIPHLTGDEQSKKAAILAISSLTTTELAGKIATLFASSGTVSALKTIAENGDDNQKTTASTALAKALENLAARESKLQDLEDAYKSGVDNNVSTGQPVDAPAEPNGLIKLAYAYKARGQYDLAAQLMIRSLTLKEKLFGSDNAAIVEGLKELADVYRLKGNTKEADLCLKRAQETEKRMTAAAKAPVAVEQTKESDGTVSPAPAHTPPAHPAGDASTQPAEEPKTSAALETPNIITE